MNAISLADARTNRLAAGRPGRPDTPAPACRVQSDPSADRHRYGLDNLIRALEAARGVVLPKA